MGSAYILDAEQPSELTRLLLQSRLIASFTGYLAEQPDPSIFQDILELACGPGDFLLALASRFSASCRSTVHLVGIDQSPVLIAYAQSEARTRQLDNITFLAGDILAPLPFPDGSFDLVSTRLLSSSMPLRSWPMLLGEAKRLLRPGGIMRLMECEIPVSTSYALTQLNVWKVEALHRTGRGDSSTECALITPFLGKFLFEAGFTQISHRASALDWSAWTKEYADMRQNTLMWYKSILPFLLKTGVVTQESVEECYEQFLQELQAPDFCALWYFLTVWGTKPGTP